MGSAGQDWERECGAKEGSFKTPCQCLHIESLAWYLPNTYLVQGIWSRAPFASKKKNTYHHHHLWQPRALALNTPFLLLLHSPPALSPRALKISHPVSLSLGCPRRSRVVCGGTVKPVRLSSLEVLQTWDTRGEASVSASACHRACPRT